MISSEAFPRLTPDNHRPTSPASIAYNCVAWAAGDVGHWWQPGVYWPAPAAADDYGIAVLEQLFKALGYEDCGTDASLEVGFEKVALFGRSLLYTHAARQLESGKWTSKLGRPKTSNTTPREMSPAAFMGRWSRS
jgi:hypothetical protein